MVDNARAPIFFVCQQGPEDDLGALADALNRAGCERTVFRAYENNSAVFEPKDHAGLIVLGGEDDKRRNADNRNGYVREKHWISQAIDQGKPVLGICLGAQLLAIQSHGSISRESVNEVGWKRVTVTEAGRTDPLLKHLAPAAAMYQSHEDTYVLSSCAVNLANSSGDSRGHSEAFRIGGNAYGVQFHPEVTRKLLEEWLRPLRRHDKYKEEKKQALEQLDEYLPRAERIAKNMFDAWIRLAIGDAHEP